MFKKMMAGVLLATLAVTAIAPAAVSAKGWNAPGIADRLENKKQFSSLNAALECTGLKEAVNETKGITLFAPGNKAFGDLLAVLPDELDTLAELCAERDTLVSVLTYHVVPDVITYREARRADGAKLPTLNTGAEPIEVSVYKKRPFWRSKVFVDQAAVTRPNFFAKNGVFHKINAVLLPTPKS